MPDASKIDFSLAEITEMLIKQSDLHEGYWQLTVEFGMAAANIGPNELESRPAAIIPLQQVSLTKQKQKGNLTYCLDANEVNPAPTKGTAKSKSK